MDRNAGRVAVGVLDEAEDDADGDETEDGVDDEEEAVGCYIPLSGRVGVQLGVEAVGDKNEADDEEELESDAAHVDV